MVHIVVKFSNMLVFLCFLFRIRTSFYEMCNPSLLVVLKENVQMLGEKWSELSYLLAEKAADLDKVDDADLMETIDNLAYNPFQVRLCFLININ